MQTTGADSAPGLVGRELGGYRILELLGAGGMGEVYRAEEAASRRPVALKVLRRSLLLNAEGRARFQREGRAAASLDHPAIAAVYEVGEAGGLPFIAMEYVQGESLWEWLGRRDLTLPDVLRVLEQLADALADAHQKGVVHRDLKPANVVVMPGGSVKLLDFGLAKLVHDEERDGGVRSQLITRPGGVLGTTAYMSPEQARGQPLDRRTDVFSFGVMLFEAIAGVPPFSGESGIEAVSGVLRDDPLPLLRDRPGLEPELVRIVEKALRKDPSDRYQHMDDLAVDLRAARRAFESMSGRAPTASRTPWPWIVTGAAVGVVLAGMLFAQRGSGRSPLPLEGTFRLRPVTFDGGRHRSPSLSPAGDLLAYSSDRDGSFDLFVQELESGRVLRLTNAPGDELDPTFSPDGRSLAYTAAGQVAVVPSLGGTPEVVAWGGSEPAWSPDGAQIALRSGGAILVVPREGGAARTLTPEGALPAVGRPAWSPDGAWIVFPCLQAGRGVLARVPATGGPVVAISEEPLEAVEPAWSSDGRWVVAAAGAEDWGQELWAVPVQHSGRVDGRPVRLLAGLGSYARPSLSRDRRKLAFQVRQLQAWVGRLPVAGERAQEPVRVEVAARVREVQASHTGDRLALVVDGPGEPTLATVAVEGGAPHTLDTRGPAMHLAWSPDDRRLAFVQRGEAGDRLALVPASGGAAELLASTAQRVGHPAWSPDGTRIAFGATVGGATSVRVMAAAGGGERTLAETARRPARVSWSPDGRWIAVGLAGDGGEPAVAAVPAGGGQPRQLLARAGAPLWLADGRVVFVREGRPGTFDLWSVRVAPDATVVPGSERRLTQLAPGLTVDGSRGASTDGRHLFFRAVAVGAEDVWLAEAR
jgi:serine/threonine protein kinase/Tol biopolymer transport system component